MPENKVVRKHFWCNCSNHYWLTADFIEGDDYRNGEFAPVKKSDLTAELTERTEGSESLRGNDETDPLDYYSKCYRCGLWVQAVPYYYANLPKMRTTGPKSEEGKARSSLNAMKHGLYAKTHHLLAPANGKYDICEDCDSKEACLNKEIKYCPFKQDLMLRFIAAYENGDLEYIKTMAGLNQGRFVMVLEQCFNEIKETGVLLKSLKVSNGKIIYHQKPDYDGGRQVGTQDDTENPLFEYKANPLIDVLPKMLETAGFSNNQQTMNPSKKEDVDDAKFKRNQLPDGGVQTFFTVMKDIMQMMSGGAAAEEAAASRGEDEVHAAITNQEEGTEDKPVVETGPAVNPFKS